MKLDGANLRGANLARANLEGASLLRTDLSVADTTDATMPGPLATGKAN